MGGVKELLQYFLETSILYRMIRRYYDDALAGEPVGTGQLVFLMYIAKLPGICPQELARIGCFDRATVTKALKKLIQEGYLRCEVDEKDRRSYHLYLTPKAEPLVEKCTQVRDGLCERLKQLCKEEELETAKQVSHTFAAALEQYLSVQKKQPQERRGKQHE